MTQKTMSPCELNESAIAGLMALGRTREEAIREIMENDRQRLDDAVHELWNHDPWSDR